MKLKASFLLIFFLLSSIAFSQNTVIGTIVDKDNQEPVFGAVVFIDNTFLTTITDKAGNFEIKNLPPGFNKIVVNKVGFKSYSEGLNVKEVLNIELRPDFLQRTPLKYDKKEERKWKRNYTQFKKAFLGISMNAMQSEILNPWVIKLNKDSNGKISAYSIDLIQLKNNGTGYIINYLLDQATIQNGRISFSGKTLFTELVAKDTAEQERWDKNRLRTHLGSKRHFLSALVNDQLDAEGFEIYKVKYDNKTRLFRMESRLSQTSIYANNMITFEDFISVVYTKESAEPAFVNEHRDVTSIPNDGLNQVTRGSYATFIDSDLYMQESFLFNRASKVVINEFGEAKNPEYLADFGYWKWERAADLMPRTYKAN